MTHKHHIIPRHEWKQRFGNLQGFNDPDNVVYLSTPQHAQAHQFLFELFSKEEDYIAWKGLSGAIGKDEAIRQAMSLGAKKKKSPETIERMKQAAIARWNRPGEREKQRERNLGEGNPCFGIKQSKESNSKRSKSLQGRPVTWKEKISKAQKGISRPQTSGTKNGNFKHGRYITT